MHFSLLALSFLFPFTILIPQALVQRHSHHSVPSLHQKFLRTSRSARYRAPAFSRLSQHNFYLAVLFLVFLPARIRLLSLSCNRPPPVVFFFPITERSRIPCPLHRPQPCVPPLSVPLLHAPLSPKPLLASMDNEFLVKVFRPNKAPFLQLGGFHPLPPFPLK